ncbi:AT-rich interactive domain-containing protein 3A [Elysia marginata]|uniref:AT-rich interactive domain-containing protein 3A n=1 Tax=Elysia marginata TaxID=1093978 RepID=A0AAV4FZQ9_9GAST|nr:AT-rich interactive domain-containing protein 3A [Elysia marginata]
MGELLGRHLAGVMGYHLHTGRFDGLSLAPGTPVNRIPIMAKQTLDLYELFRLVVSKGGLVEVINKKLWREITKGLNLPSSITSAAFTLRTHDRCLEAASTLMRTRLANSLSRSVGSRYQTIWRIRTCEIFIDLSRSAEQKHDAPANVCARGFYIK